MSSFTFVSVADVTLLGAPLFPGKVLDNTWLARCEDLKRAVEDFLCLVPRGQDAHTAAGFFQCPQSSASFAVRALSGQSRP